MKPSDVIQQRLASKKSELDEQSAIINEATRRMEILKAETAAWEEALRLITSIAPPAPIVGRSIMREPENTKGSGDSRRGPKGAWRIIMPEMVRHYPSGPFTTADVVAAGELVGAPVKGPTVRSQMSNYATQKYVERVSQGKFKFTERGRSAFAASQGKQTAIRLVTESPTAHDVQAVGVRGAAIPEASHDQVSTGGD